MGNPLINELIIGTGSKDFWSMSQPANDSQFASFDLDPLFARVLNAIYGIAIPTPPRTDLLPLVTYAPPIAAPGTTAGPIADLLRLNTGVQPTPQNSRKRLGLLAGDGFGMMLPTLPPARWPGFWRDRNTTTRSATASIPMTFRTRKSFRTSPSRKAAGNAAISTPARQAAPWAQARPVPPISC
jgi:hypothetical protein